MVNLEEKAGLPVRLLDGGKLSFSPEVEVDRVSARNFSDLKPVAKDQNTALADDPAYFMYRNVRISSDSEKIGTSGLRFDLTVMPAGRIGSEYVKTSGHYHPKKIGTTISYPELYYVISGQATYLLQKDDEGIITDIIVANLSAGEAIIIPISYGHVTINEGREPLVMANWIADGFQSDYSEYERLQGGAYYVVDKFGSPGLVKNPKYGDLPAARGLKPKQELLNLSPRGSIYGFSANLALLDFLRNPEDYQEELQIDQLFNL